MSTRFILLALAAAILGCDTVPDSHPEVFQNLQQAVIDRKSRLMTEWQDLAVSIAQSERPDLSAEKLPPTSVHVGADGSWRTLDLAPLSDQINSHPEMERQIIATAIDGEIKKLDSQRLIALGFARARELLSPRLIGARAASAATQPAAVNVAGINWIAVARLKGANVDITDDVLAAWKVSDDDVDRAALANLAADWAHATNPIETQSLDPFGQTGTLRADVNPASILLPEFLPAARKAFKTGDDFAIVLPSPPGITFVPRGNEDLLAILYPLWKRELLKADDPISSLPMKLSSQGWSFLDYALKAIPATAPATKPAPTPYLVQ